MNGEFDALTPRKFHENLRKHIKNCKLILMQHVCHAFTLEIPVITALIIEDFIHQIEKKKWIGDRSVWIATDNPSKNPLLFPCEGDHNRNIPINNVVKSGDIND